MNYKWLKGFVHPESYRAIGNKTDDFIRGLHGLDERMIENIVSQRDAYANARDAAKELQQRLWQLPENRGKSAEQFAEEFASKTKPDLINFFWGKDPRTIEDFHFPKEYEEHFNPDEIGQLSSQYANAKKDYADALQQKYDLQHKLEGRNAQEMRNRGMTKMPSLVDEEGLELIADERFRKIRSALKAMENK